MWGPCHRKARCFIFPFISVLGSSHAEHVAFLCHLSLIFLYSFLCSFLWKVNEQRTTTTAKAPVTWYMMPCNLAFFKLRCVLYMCSEELHILGYSLLRAQIDRFGPCAQPRHWTQCSKEYKGKYNVDFAFHKLRRATTHARLWGLDFQGPHARAMDSRSGKDTHTPRDVLMCWVTSELCVKNGHYLGMCFKYIPVQRHNLEHARRRANASVWMEQTVHDVKRREIMPER